MFFSDPDLDLKVMLWLIGFALVISVGVYVKWKHVFGSWLLFSVLANGVVYLNAGSRFFDIYNLKWIVAFTLHYWPYINLVGLVILVAVFLKNHYAK